MEKGPVLLKKGPSGDLDFGSEKKGLDSSQNDRNAPGAFGAEEENLEADTVTLDQTFMSNASADGMNTSGPKNPPASSGGLSQFDQPLASFKAA